MKHLQLLLTDPCTMQWNDIVRENGKHYCDVCEKHIVDLSEKSDAELIDFFRKKKENVCGRLLASQLNRKLQVPQTGLKFRWLMPLAMGTAAVNPVFAQNFKPIMVQADLTPSPSKPLNNLTEKKEFVKTTIVGKVVDKATGKPLKGVKITTHAYHNVLAMTDTEGRFEIKTTKFNISETFIFDLPGYGRVSSVLHNEIVVSLVATQTIMLGAVAVVNVNKSPLYVINAGSGSCTIDSARMGEISPEWIQKIQVLKGVEATAIYGSRGANGVVVVEIKKEYFKKIDFSKKKKG